MSKNPSADSRSPLWTGRPWILPSAVARTILTIVAVVAVSWLELHFGVKLETVPNIQIILLTNAVLFLIWILSLMQLSLLRASSTYILRNDSLEIRTGILTSRSFVVAPSGFSDLEVVRSVSSRIAGSGDIIIRTQSERDGNRNMQKI